MFGSWTSCTVGWLFVLVEVEVCACGRLIMLAGCADWLDVDGRRLILEVVVIWLVLFARIFIAFDWG